MVLPLVQTRPKRSPPIPVPLTPVLEKLTLVLEKLTLVLEKLTPVLEKLTPVLEKPIPVLEKPIPVLAARLPPKSALHKMGRVRPIIGITLPIGVELKLVGHFPKGKILVLGGVNTLTVSS